MRLASWVLIAVLNVAALQQVDAHRDLASLRAHAARWEAALSGLAVQVTLRVRVEEGSKTGWRLDCFHGGKA